MVESPFGFLNIFKEKGMTSHDVVNKVRKILGIKKIGHAGTLDPNAQGVLLVGVGRATKYIQYLEILDKTYDAELILGKSTDTDDITGQVLSETTSSVTAEQLNRILPRFTGEIEQIPPLYSAIHIDGQRLYDRARRGESVEIPPRKIQIFELSSDDLTQLPEKAQLHVRCSKGTYIRSLCRDLGEAMGISACMGDLTRTQVGKHSINHSVTLEVLQQSVAEGRLAQIMLSPNVVLSHYRSVSVMERGVPLVSNGCVLYPWNSTDDFDTFRSEEILRFMGPKGFMGLGLCKQNEDPPYIRPLKLL